MNPERWARAEQLYARAKLLPADEWPLFLAGEAGDDIELVDVVLDMLRTPPSGGFIEPPPSGDAPRQAPSGDAWIGRKLGDCEIVAKLGQGGMGLVFRARQAALKRDVALKILPFQSLSRPSHVARFEKEARIAAQLNHKNIVKIHDVRVDGDVRWFTMELVDGPDLGKEIARLRAKGAAPADAKDAHLPPFESREYVARVVELVAQAADALECAHRAGVVHRDIKPGNLLVDAAGEMRVVDFGLARHDERDEGGEEAPPLTRSGDLLGTPHYMSPEQVRRKAHRVDGRTDVWSLGVVLYELLTLARPFDGGTDVEIARKITDEEPTPLRKLAPRVPKDLETICAVAMGREPSDRYSSAGNLRDDLRRFLAHEAIVARPLPLSRRVARFARRRRIELVAAGVALLAATAGFAWADRAAVLEQRAKDARLIGRASELTDFERDPGLALQAVKRLAELGPRPDGFDEKGLASMEQLREQLAKDLAARIVRIEQLYMTGKADRVDSKLFGEFRSGPAERDLGEALRLAEIARKIHGDVDQLVELSRVENTWAEVAIRLADETQSAPRAGEAKAWAAPIDDLYCQVDPAHELGAVPGTWRLPPGHWRLVVEIPDFGISEHARTLLPSVLPTSIVARVQPAASLAAGMKRIEAGVFDFRNDDRFKLGRCEVRDKVPYASFWIDEAELSNREFVAYLEASGAPLPEYWVVGLKCRDRWRDLPLGDRIEQWLDLPAVALTLAEATACAEWYGKRLPMQIELERSMRGAASVFAPWGDGARTAAGGRCNVDQPPAPRFENELARFELYLQSALPVRAAGYQQQPEGLFHALGNVTEVTESYFVEETAGRLIANPWARIHVGGTWEAARHALSFAARSNDGITRQYARTYVGFRCARSDAVVR